MVSPAARLTIALLAAVSLTGARAQAADPFEGLGEAPRLLEDAKWDAKRGAYVTTAGPGRIVELTLDRGLQTGLDQILRRYSVPAAAVVALDPRTGRVLAVSEHSNAPKPLPGLAFRANYPAASIFKIVTGAALLESGVEPDTEVCFHGGKRRLELRNLQDDPRRDNRCATLARAMGFSLNVVFAKLAARHLDADVLRTTAGRFLFNQPLGLFPAPPSLDRLLVSPADIPEDPLGFGRTAAGFGEVFLSPLHGAVLAGGIGHGGLAFEPRLVAAVEQDGVRTPAPDAVGRRLVDESVASRLAGMLEVTVAQGTARQAFRERRRHVLGPVQAAGKTGSLAHNKPYRDYSWFVGWAPADNPTIAVAAVVVNPLRWVIKAPYLAREALRLHVEAEKERVRRAAR